MFEFITGGGFLDRPVGAIPDSLLREGTAMRNALVADFGSLPDCDVCVLADEWLPAPRDASARIYGVATAEAFHEAFTACARDADWSLIIAPEFDSHLERLARRVKEVGGRLMGPSPEVIALAADKHRLAEHLHSHGIRTPRGVTLGWQKPLLRDFSYPAVIKPIDGCGSLGISRVDGADAVCNRDLDVAMSWRLEEYCPGVAASVALLCGPAGVVPLPACRQELSDDGHFTYLGGSLPLANGLAQRAQRLAARAVLSLGAELGYMGVDLVLGDDPGGTQDTVIEINPRLTTSYVGLRAACESSLARAMLDAANGREARLTFADRRIRFSADGHVQASNLSEQPT